MDAEIPEAMNMQTFMFVWDINLNITKKMNRTSITSPVFSLKPNEGENTNYIELRRCGDKIGLDSNFSSQKELKRCTIYMLNPLTRTLLNVCNGFKIYTSKNAKWSEKVRLVIELEIQCDAPAVHATVWKHFITEVKPALYTVEAVSLDAKEATHTVVNNRGVSCFVERFVSDNRHKFKITTERPSKDWSLLTLMLRKLEDNDWERIYIHTTDFKDTIDFQSFQPLIVLQIQELTTSVKNVSVFEMAAITGVIKPHLLPSTVKSELLQPNISTNIAEYFAINKFCDITVEIGDQQIRAHKIMLVAGSTKLRDRCYDDETLGTIVIDDFHFKTIRQMIEYMYTGVVKQPMDETEQLLSAAHEYGVSGLKELCEVRLLDTIVMENCVKLLVLADRCDANVLFKKILMYVKKNYAEFMKLEDTKSLFVMHPELAFKVFANIH